MIRHRTVTLTVPGGAELTAPVLDGKDGVSRKVHNVLPQQTAGMNLRAYLNTDQVIDVPSNMIGATAPPWIPAEVPLAVGDTFNVGFLNTTGGALTAYAVIQYEE